MSHITVLLPLARELLHRGYDVVFPGLVKHKPYFDAVGVPFTQLYSNESDSDRNRLSEISNLGYSQLLKSKLIDPVSGDFGVGIWDRLGVMCSVAAGGSWHFPRYRFKIGEEEFCLSSIREKLADVLHQSMENQILRVQKAEKRDIFLVIDSVLPWVTGRHLMIAEEGKDEVVPRMLVSTMITRLRQNPLTFPFYVGDTLVPDFSVGIGLKQTITQIALMIACPNLLSRASKMSWNKDVMLVIPSLVGLDYYVGENDMSPLRRYVGFLSLTEDERGTHLDPEARKWLDSKSRVVYVSAGSALSFPESILKRAMQVFQNLNLSVLLLGKGLNSSLVSDWKNDFGTNLLVWDSWINQYDVLRHPSTKLILAHAGGGGIVESIRTRTPILAVPLTADQYQTASRLVERGLGERIVDQDDLNLSRLEMKVRNLVFDRRDLYLRDLMKVDHLSRMQGEESALADIVEEVMWYGLDHLSPFLAPGLNWLLRFLKIIAGLVCVLIILWMRRILFACCRASRGISNEKKRN